MTYINSAKNNPVKNTDTNKSPIKNFDALLNRIGTTGEVKDDILVRLNNLVWQSGIKEMDLNVLISRRGFDNKLIAIEGEDGIEIKRADPRIKFEGKDFGIKAELHIWLGKIDQIKNPHEKMNVIKQMIKYFDRKKYGLLIGYSKTDDILVVYPIKGAPEERGELVENVDFIHTDRVAFDLQGVEAYGLDVIRIYDEPDFVLVDEVDFDYQWGTTGTGKGDSQIKSKRIDISDEILRKLQDL